MGKQGARVTGVWKTRSDQISPVEWMAQWRLIVGIRGWRREQAVGQERAKCLAGGGGRIVDAFERIRNTSLPGIEPVPGSYTCS